MDELTLPLDEGELDELDAFLLERVDESAVGEGQDEGVLDVAELDGLLTAVVSGPVAIPPSAWLTAVWGDMEPAFEDEAEANEILGLMTRHMNSIALLLDEEPEHFEPLFNERRVDGITYTIVDEWCEGYLRGVALAQVEWDAGGEDVARLLEPIAAFTAAAGWPGHEVELAESDRLRRAIAPSVRALFEHWAGRRRQAAATPAPVHRLEPRVGRNDPCPCGSGRKYKKCCLH